MSKLEQSKSNSSLIMLALAESISCGEEKLLLSLLLESMEMLLIWSASSEFMIIVGVGIEINIRTRGRGRR